MDKKLTVFVSSVQKELENERLTILSLITTDLFIKEHCNAVLYEFSPASPEKSAKECLQILDSCDVCISIIATEYGHKKGSLSITHQEYRRAKKNKIPLLIFVKGSAGMKRHPQTEKWIGEIRKDGFKYKRFGNILELQREVRGALLKLLKDRFNIKPSAAESRIAEQTIDAASGFELQTLKRLAWKKLDRKLAEKLVSKDGGQKRGKKASTHDILENSLVRGLVWMDTDSGEYYGTAAGIVLLAHEPSAVFPQCRILADAYRGEEPDGNPADHEDIQEAMPLAIDRAIAFVDRNTRHPMRIVGLERVRLDEYPAAALREALVNAVAHRNYEDAGRKIMLEVFSNKVVVSSPGMPPRPLTIQKLRTGKYKPCSRNPIIAHGLSYFHRIEERGSGFRRMRENMLDHGLEPPVLAEDSGYFQVVFKGPGKNINRLRVQGDALKRTIPPSVEEKLNDRQKKIVEKALRDGTVATAWCINTFRVVKDTARRDFNLLVKLGILEPIGRGRSKRYAPKDTGR